MNKIEQQIADTMRSAADSMDAWQRTGEDFRAMLHGIEQQEEDGKPVSMYMGSAYVSISISGDKATLTRVVRWLRKFGYKTCDPRPAKDAVSWSPRFERAPPQDETIGDRERFEAENPCVHLYFTSTVCRRVQVGTEMREMPVYEVRCDGDGTE